jgi:hypothetical protein
MPGTFGLSLRLVLAIVGVGAVGLPGGGHLSAAAPVVMELAAVDLEEIHGQAEEPLLGHVQCI